VDYPYSNSCLGEKKEVSNIDLLVFEHPKTMVEQITEKLRTTTKEWILFLDNDASLSTYTLELFRENFTFYGSADIVRFYWKNNPSGSRGIGLYRVSALKKINFSVMPSIGLDIILQGLLLTKDSPILSFYHPVKEDTRAVFRYGKGRGFYFRMIKGKHETPKNPPNIRKLRVYLIWFAGFVCGMISPIKDSSW
jgi:hypothetical protein